jgi:hypothetical protein
MLYQAKSSCNTFIFFLGLLLTQDLCYHPSSNSSTNNFTSQAEQRKALAAAVSAHVQTCGSFEKPICQQITNKTHQIITDAGSSSSYYAHVP